VPLEVVCAQKVLAIGFGRFPARIRSFEGHDKLNDLLVAAIPEINRDGLDGGFYRQTLHVWITIDCEGVPAWREDAIVQEFADITERFCYPRRFRSKKKPVP